MKPLMKGIISVILLIISVLFTGNVTHGNFVGMEKHMDKRTIQATYQSFSGVLARKVNLRESDRLRFTYQGQEGLRALVRQGKDEVFIITNASELTIPQDGHYAITVEGTAKNGAFDLTWVITPAPKQNQS